MNYTQTVALDSCVVIGLIDGRISATKLRLRLKGKQLKIVLCEKVLDEVKKVRGISWNKTMPNALTPMEIAKNPEQYLCALGFFSFKSLIDMNPKSGAVYIHSASEPWTEEQGFGVERRDNWINHFGMEQHQIHCSGHATGEDLLEMVKDIDSQMVYPIHTDHPAEYKKITDKITLVEKNKTYKI